MPGPPGGLTVHPQSPLRSAGVLSVTALSASQRVTLGEGRALHSCVAGGRLGLTPPPRAARTSVSPSQEKRDAEEGQRALSLRAASPLGASTGSGRIGRGTGGL